jgi:hypothetical protein
LLTSTDFTIAVSNATAGSGVRVVAVVVAALPDRAGEALLLCALWVVGEVADPDAWSAALPSQPARRAMVNSPTAAMVWRGMWARRVTGSLRVGRCGPGRRRTGQGLSCWTDRALWLRRRLPRGR